MVDSEYEDRMMLAEANQPPIEVVDYFGDGDECHMAYHFPVMPPLYMALRRERANDIVEALVATPPIPDGCQWGVFLRNHDELTLEMVTDEDRQFMYEQYAPDPAMKKNVGIRRRLMPLIENDRSSFELLHGVLLSLPGSPFLYYGDEIGMGDDIALRDRDGVRTPMQWNSDPAGGFSTADPSSFYLPVISHSDYSPLVVNVEDQRSDPQSLLNWLRELIAQRKNHPIFGSGEFSLVDIENEAVLAYQLVSSESRMLILANFSRSTQTVDLSSPYVDIRSDAAVETAIDLDGHGFAWLQALPL